MGGGDDPNVHGNPVGSAHALDLPVLQDPQQPNLSRRRHLPDLVEQDRPPVGSLESTALPGKSARERTLLVSEKLTVQEGLRDGAAVDGNERSVPTGRAEVDDVGDHVLSDPGLSGQQDGALGRRHLADLPHDLSQTKVRSDDFVSGAPQQLAM